MATKTKAQNESKRGPSFRGTVQDFFLTTRGEDEKPYMEMDMLPEGSKDEQTIRVWDAQAVKLNSMLRSGQHVHVRTWEREYKGYPQYTARTVNIVSEL